MSENYAAYAWLDTTHLLNLKLTSWITICSGWIMIPNIYTTVTISHCVKSRYLNFLISEPFFMSLTLNVDRFTIIYCLRTQQMRTGWDTKDSEPATRRSRHTEGMSGSADADAHGYRNVMGNYCGSTESYGTVEHQQRQCQEAVGQRLQFASNRSVAGKLMWKLLFGEGGDWRYKGEPAQDLVRVYCCCVSVWRTPVFYSCGLC